MALVSLSSLGYAQSDADKAAARAAAQQGVQAYTEGRYADAADLLNRAETLYHAPPHVLYQARTQEKLGHLIEARELYMKLTRETLAPTAPEVFRSAQADANAELTALEARIPYLTVVLTPANANAKVMLDGVELPPAMIGLESPINPGKHRAVALVGTTEGPAQEIDVVEGARLKVEVSPAAPAAPVVTAPPATPQDQGTSDPGKGLRIGGYVALGVGVVGLGVGTVFLVSGAGKKGDADDAFDACNSGPGGCSVTEERNVNDLEDDAASAKTISLVGYGVGAAGIGTGIVLLVLAGNKSADNTQAHITPWVGWQSAGVSGTF
ncbi:MAG TPA: hypothetical protein VHO25_17625 [Polyangiaceae bacterium]|nr:hypothetical protein [Polyangiaceae bacterium]